MLIRDMHGSKGFTIIELLVAMTILVILATMVVMASSQTLPNARDTERVNDAASLARRLEQAYVAQEVGGPSYPSTTRLLADIAMQGGTVDRLDPDATKAPEATSSSVVAATSPPPSAPKGAGSPVLDEYVYQPLTSNGTLCTGTDICVRFFLYYRLEVSKDVVTLKSLRQQ